jgi:hypothetical protein
MCYLKSRGLILSTARQGFQDQIIKKKFYPSIPYKKFCHHIDLYFGPTTHLSHKPSLIYRAVVEHMQLCTVAWVQAVIGALGES